MKTYIYRAAIYCEDCANNIKAQITMPANYLREDSNHWPQGPFPYGGGESDCPQHCDCCGTFLENPLTPDGDKYVCDLAKMYDYRDASWSDVADAAENDGQPVLAMWIRYYYAPGM